VRAVIGAIAGLLIVVFAAAVVVPPPVPPADPLAPVVPLKERATIVLDPAVPLTTPTRGTVVQVSPTAPPPTTTSTTTAAQLVPSSARCPQWWDEAQAAGWPEWSLPRIDYVMWRESRCLPTAHNPRPPDDSYGLVQLNMRAHRSWVGPLVNWDFNRLFDPTTNLRTARRLFDMAQQAYGCGWQPWQTSGWSPC
jgi:hypothetical protein